MSNDESGVTLQILPGQDVMTRTAGIWSIAHVRAYVFMG